MNASYGQKTANTGWPRSLRLALLLSFAAHALLLMPSWPQPGAPVSAPLAVRIGAASAPPPHAEAGISTAGKTPGERRTQKEMEKSPSASAATSASATGSASPPANRLPRAAIPKAPRLAASEGLDPNGIAEFRMNLALQTQRLQPGFGAMRGRVEARVGVGGSGRRLPPEVTRSSGIAALDAAVAAMLQRAAYATPVPASLQGREFTVDVAVEVGKE